MSPSLLRRRGPHAAGAAVLAMALLAGCGSGDTDADGTLKIGLLASLSGTYKPVGQDLRDGFKLYLDTHDGKLGGHPVDLKIGDEGDGPSTALPAANKLVKKEKVTALTGMVGGGTVKAVQPLAAKNKIPLIGSNARPGKRNDKKPYVWHTSYLSDEPGQAIAEYMKKKVDGSVYAIGPDYQGGYDEMRGFTSAFKKAGGKLANPKGKTTWTPFPKTTNFSPYFAKIKKSDAKAVYCFYAGKAAIDFVKQYAKSDVSDLPLYSAGFLTEGPGLKAQGKSAEGIYSALNYAPDLDNSTNRKFASAWTTKHHTQPTTYAMASYDAAAVLDKAIAKAGQGGGEINGETINKAIKGLGKIDSPRGTWEFGSHSQAPVQKWYLRQVRRDGKKLSNLMVRDLATLGG